MFETFYSALLNGHGDVEGSSKTYVISMGARGNAKKMTKCNEKEGGGWGGQ